MAILIIASVWPLIVDTSRILALELDKDKALQIDNALAEVRQSYDGLLFLRKGFASN